MSDISKNSISNISQSPKDYESMDINDKLEINNLREDLKRQHCVITDTSKWAEIDEDELLRIFKIDEKPPKRLTEEEVKQKILDTFNTTSDPLSVEALKEQFPNFPDEWYSYVSRAATEKITLIKQEEEVNKKQGFFNIKFN